jgi:hypothetical protein
MTNPSYSGGKDQEDCCSKPAWANSLQDPIPKIPITKKAGGVAQGVGLEFKPWYQNKKKKKLSSEAISSLWLITQRFFVVVVYYFCFLSFFFPSHNPLKICQLSTTALSQG